VGCLQGKTKSTLCSGMDCCKTQIIVNTVAPTSTHIPCLLPSYLRTTSNQRLDLKCQRTGTASSSWTGFQEKASIAFVWHCCMSTLCLPDDTACDKISRALSLCICILQVIKDWRWERPGNETNQDLYFNNIKFCLDRV